MLLRQLKHRPRLISYHEVEQIEGHEDYAGFFNSWSIFSSYIFLSFRFIFLAEMTRIKLFLIVNDINKNLSVFDFPKARGGDKLYPLCGTQL